MSSLHRCRRAFAFVLVVLLLAACGNKGELVKPTPNPASVPANPPPATPAH